MRDMSCTEVTDDGQRDKRSQLPNQYKPQSANVSVSLHGMAINNPTQTKLSETFNLLNFYNLKKKKLGQSLIALA